MHYHIRIESQDTGSLVREHWHTDNYSRIPGLIASYKRLVQADIRRVAKCHAAIKFKEV